MESRNMSEKEFEEFQRLLARELGAVDSEKDKEEEKEITEMLRHESVAHDPYRKSEKTQQTYANTTMSAQRSFLTTDDYETEEKSAEIKTDRISNNTETTFDTLENNDIDKMLRHETKSEPNIAAAEEPQVVTRGKYEKVIDPSEASDEPKAPKASEILRKTGKYEKVTEEQEGYFNPERPNETAAERRRRARKNSRILRTVIGISAVFVVGLSAGLIVNTIKMKQNSSENDQPVSAVQTDINGNIIETPTGECNIVGITPLNNFTAVLEGGTAPIPISMSTTGTAAADDILWVSSDTSVAEVTEDGIIKGVSAGVCDITISAKANPSIKAQISCTVRKMEKKNGVTYVDGILLINKSYGADASYDPGELTEETQNAFDELCAAAAEEDLNIYYASGYRSHDEQVEIYNDYVDIYGADMADTFSARPGFSEHQSALVIDVNSIDDTFTDTPEAKWLEKHCAEFGFIIRYPKGKENITGYKYESWHIRYVGKELAKEITELGITLDEYLGVDSVYADDYKENDQEETTEVETGEAETETSEAENE